MPKDSFSSSASGKPASSGGAPPARLPAAGAFSDKPVTNAPATGPLGTDKFGENAWPDFGADAASLKRLEPPKAAATPATVLAVPATPAVPAVPAAAATAAAAPPVAATPVVAAEPAAAPVAPAGGAEVAGGAWEAILEAEFLSKDRNGDGFLSMKEISIKELLELDVDHNGFISIEEFFAVFVEKSEIQFKTMDLDRDGFLKPREFAKGTPTPQQEANYKRYASNAEAGLTLDEYRNYLAEQRGKKR